MELVRTWLLALCVIQTILYITLLAFYSTDELDIHGSPTGVYRDYHSAFSNGGYYIVISCSFHLAMFGLMTWRIKYSPDGFGCGCPPRDSSEAVLTMAFICHVTLSLMAFISNCQGFHDQPCFHYTTPLMVLNTGWTVTYFLIVVLHFIYFMLQCQAPTVVERLEDETNPA